MKKLLMKITGNDRIPHLILFVLGIIAGFVRFYLNIKPKLLNIKVFAFYSEYLDNKFMKVVNNNIGEEITILLIISGLFIFAFTREKDETAALRDLRFNAFVASFYLSFVFLIGATLFTFGLAFIYMLVLFMSVPLFTYILVFRILLFHHNKKISAANENTTLE
jgi:amino acid transporter